MREKISFYQLPKEASLLSSLTRFRRMLKKALNLAEPREDFNEDEWFFSNVEVAQFIGCSMSTVRRLRKRGKLYCIQHGNVCLFRIATVLHLIANDDHLASLFLRKKPRRVPRAPKIYYRIVLTMGTDVYVNVRYMGWRCTIVCSRRISRNEKLVQKLVLKIVNTWHRHVKPFKISPDGN